MFEWRCSFSQQDKDMVHPYNSHLNQQFMLVIVLFEPSKQTHNTRNNPVHSLNLVLPSLVFSKIRDFKAENVIFFFLKNGLSLCNKGWVHRNKRSRMFNTKTVCLFVFWHQLLSQLFPLLLRNLLFAITFTSCFTKLRYQNRKYIFFKHYNL